MTQSWENRIISKEAKSTAKHIGIISEGAIQTLIDEVRKAERERIIKEIDKLIAQEILICHKENQPTSRLTSLAVKIDKLLTPSSLSE